MRTAMRGRTGASCLACAREVARSVTAGEGSRAREKSKCATVVRQRIDCAGQPVYLRAPSDSPGLLEPMRILFLSNYALPHLGGIEVVVDAMARELSARGHEVRHVTAAA